jgi:hypothetical protein
MMKSIAQVNFITHKQTQAVEDGLKRHAPSSRAQSLAVYPRQQFNMGNGHD